MAVGLGKYIVDGGRGLRFSPRYPAHALQTSTLDLALRDTQRRLFALPNGEGAEFAAKVDEGASLEEKDVQDFAGKGAFALHPPAPTTLLTACFRDSDFGRGRKVITFANILRDKVVPRDHRFHAQAGTKCDAAPGGDRVRRQCFPVANGDGIRETSTGCRYGPIIDKRNLVSDQVLELPDSRLIVRSGGHALGNGMAEGVSTIVYVKPGLFRFASPPRLCGAAENQRGHAPS